VLIPLVVAFLLVGGQSVAQQPGSASAGAPGTEIDPKTREKVERLFRQGTALMDAGSYAQACPLLSEAWKSGGGGGTILALAFCHEGEHRYATALGEFRTGLSLAVRASRPDQAELARGRIRELEAKVSRVILSAQDEGVVVTVDDAMIEHSDWAAGVPVDGGDHVVRAKLSGHEPWERSVTVANSGDAHRVEVPRLSAAPSPPHPVIVTERRPELGIAIAAVGAVVLGVGGYFGLHALDEASRSKDLCNPGPCSDRTGVDLATSADRDAWVANVAIPIGVIGIGVGLYLALRKVSVASPPARTGMSPLVAPLQIAF
jgi:hypothetical protein